MAEEDSSRDPWLAAIFSFFCPGLGQFYNGRPWLGLILYLCLSLGLVSVFCWISLAAKFGVIAVYGVMVVTFLAVFAVAVQAFCDGRGQARLPTLFFFLLLGVDLFPLRPGLVALLDSTFLPMRSFSISSASMSPTLQQGDVVLADLTQPLPRAGEITLHVRDGQTYVHRAVAVEGQKVEIADGRVQVDGQLVTGPWAEPPTGTWSIDVPKGHFFVLGDNINNAADSRFFGPVAYEDLYGKVVLRIWGCELGTEF